MPFRLRLAKLIAGHHWPEDESEEAFHAMMDHLPEHLVFAIYGELTGEGMLTVLPRYGEY